MRRKGWLRNVCAQEGLVKECVRRGYKKGGSWETIWENGPFRVLWDEQKKPGGFFFKKKGCQRCLDWPAVFMFDVRAPLVFFTLCLCTFSPEVLVETSTRRLWVVNTGALLFWIKPCPNEGLRFFFQDGKDH